MKKYIIIIVLSFFLFSIIDYFFGKKILNFMYSSQIIKNPQIVKMEEERLFKMIQKKEKEYRIKNNYYHHTLKPNVKIGSTWGTMRYTTCTDKYGFRSLCKKQNKKNYNKTIVIIGDSFTEGLGLNYNETFGGMYTNHSQLQVLNMGVTSYSPIIYYHKLKYYIDSGLRINHVIVFIDISDIDDEANVYKLCDNKKTVCDNITKKKLSVDNVNSEKKNFYLLNKIGVEIKKLKRTIRPKNYIYQKNFHRSNWTFIEENTAIKKGINNSLKYMDELSNYLNSNNISLSVAVYPHPGQILFDNVNSKQVKIWKNFCTSKCKYFINAFPTFFEDKGKIKNMRIINKYYIENDMHFNKEGNAKMYSLLKNYDF